MALTTVVATTLYRGRDYSLSSNFLDHRLKQNVKKCTGHGFLRSNA